MEHPRSSLPAAADTLETNLTRWLEACERAAREGGRVLGTWVGRFGVENKGPRDLVTEADRESQRAIRDILLGEFPDHAFVGEEGHAFVGEEGDDERVGRPWREGAAGGEPPLTWFVDPLDGTTNYVHGYPAYCVSIALFRGDTPLVATVYDPVAEECFVAAAGLGARCNGRPIRVSAAVDLAESLVAVSFPAHPSVESAAVEDFLAALPLVRSVRRSGSTALNLAWLASGRLDAFWARRIQSWDVAAGFLLVSEAGGTLGRFAADPASPPGPSPIPMADPSFIAAASIPLLEGLQRLFASHDGRKGI